MRTSIWFPQVGQPAGLQGRCLHKMHRAHFQRFRVSHPTHSTPVFSESLFPVHRTSSQLSSLIEHRDPADPRNSTGKTEFTEKLATPERVSGSQARTVSPRDLPICLQLSHVNYLTTVYRNENKIQCLRLLMALNTWSTFIRGFLKKFDSIISPQDFFLNYKSEWVPKENNGRNPAFEKHTKEDQF